MPDRSPSHTPSTTPSAVSTPSRRLLSKLASPFASKSRNLTDFFVNLDDPHKQHAPGDLVTGFVNLKILKPTRITHVVVCLHGFVQVYKEPGIYKSPSYIGTGQGSKGGQYFGNGFASLFEDEVVLCGDGRLGEGVYQFQFNLEFPDRDLPSSISFERGTVSYMVTATLTRPTTMSPIFQCDQKVYLVEKIDISQLEPPKARTITLEPLSRRTRARTQARKIAENVEKKSRKDGSDQLHSDHVGRESHSSSNQSSPQQGGHVRAQTPEPSETSFESRLSSMGRRSQQGSMGIPRRQSDPEGGNGSSRASFSTRTITATVESLAGGVLRGDSVPIRVHVDHTKQVKSLHGIIITLYRQARVDLHPAIPLGPVEKGKEAKYEDYYPKSWTGLGGLSLSGAGSSHMFRKDLSQTTVPLMVDPDTLTAEVTGRVLVPEDAFPTIATVPGAMISFKYFVEVIIDIQGKLATQDRNLGNLGGLANTVIQGHGGESLDRALTYASGVPVIDTAAVRRDKGVVACTFEVVVGTRDSARKKGKNKAANAEAEPPQPNGQIDHQHPNSLDAVPGAQSQEQDWNYEGADYTYGSFYGYDPQYYPQGTYAPAGGVYGGYEDYTSHGAYYGAYSQHGDMTAAIHNPAPPNVLPVPPTEDESQLSEKERIRRQEQRLLPSQPPGMADDDTSHSATAPHLPDELSNGGVGSSSAASGSMYLTPPAYGEGRSSANGVRFEIAPPSQTSHVEAEILPPTSSTPTPGIETPVTDDKRELERRRLRQQASAPPLDESNEAGPSSAGHAATAPTAPTLTDDELYGDGGVGGSRSGTDHPADSHSQLPRYER